MKSNVIKRTIIKRITMAGALALSFNLLMLSACAVLPATDNDKDDNSQNHATVSENENGGKETNANPVENTDNNKPDNAVNTNDNNSNDEDNKPTNTEPAKAVISNDGFSIINEKSFAAKAVGTYQIYSADGYNTGFLEIYNIGNNLYGEYSGYGYAGLEFFATSSNGFESEDVDSMEVKIATFDSDFTYWSNGMPAYLTMTLTDDGIEFSNYQSESGYLPFDEDSTLKRLDEEMGHLDGFAYKDDEYSARKHCEDLGIETMDEYPESVVGSWILLGDADLGIIMELTDDGLAQVYLKNVNEPVILLRGGYALSKEKFDGANNIYFDLVSFANGPEEENYYLGFTLDDKGYMLCAPGDDSFGAPLVWDGAAFIPFDVNAYARQYHDEYSMADNFNETTREYISEDGLMLVLNDDNTFMIYDSEDLSNLEAFVEGRYEENPGGLSLYTFSYENGDEDYYGAVTFLDARNVQLGIYRTKETISLKPNN